MLLTQYIHQWKQKCIKTIEENLNWNPINKVAIMALAYVRIRGSSDNLKVISSHWLC